jgi:sulfate/thiosulfate transport system ATP-binding protein
MSIAAQNISKTFGTFPALKDVSLSVDTGELVALLGPSGSGKTTLLRIIAGLEQPDAQSGPITFNNQNVADRDVGSRQVGFVFQHYALFRHMSVFENVAFGLRVRPRRGTCAAGRRPAKEQIQAKVFELLKLVQLDVQANRFPHQLSGGQRQRVALARALAIEPKVLLLDEPFGALDARVRQELRQWLRRLHDEIHLTSVFVTHDQDEAMELADRVVVMNEGRVEQTGTPDEVFHNPKTEFVMNFLGQVNTFHGRVEDGKVHFATMAVDLGGKGDSPHLCEAPSGPFRQMGTVPFPPPAMRHVRVFVRPHDLEIETHRNGHPAFAAVITRVNSAGPNVRLELRSQSGELLQAEMPQDRYRSLNVRLDSQVFVSPRSVKVFGAEPSSFGHGEGI